MYKKREAGLAMAAAALVALSLAMIFLYAPTEAGMGAVQRIFYLHVPVAWVAFAAFSLVFVASILYLVKRARKWDTLALASAEAGVIFTTLVLITGPLWARPVWGVWWTWDVRLTTSLVMWFIYVAYLMVRSFAADEERGARFAAVVGIIGFLDIPLVAISISMWRTQHPAPLVMEGGLAPPMLLTLLVSMLAFTAVFALLVSLRVAMKNDERRVRMLRQRARSGLKEG